MNKNMRNYLISTAEDILYANGGPDAAVMAVNMTAASRGVELSESEVVEIFGQAANNWGKGKRTDYNPFNLG